MGAVRYQLGRRQPAVWMVMQDLLILESVDGIPIPLSSGKDLDFGEYNITEGATLEFFLKNINITYSIDISDLHITENNATLHTPNNIIKPQETLKCFIKVKAPPSLLPKDIAKMELPYDNFHLKGKTKFMNYHSRFENE